MHKTRAIPIGEPGETRGRDAKGTRRKTQNGKRRGSDESVQGTTNHKRVSNNNQDFFYVQYIYTYN